MLTRNQIKLLRALGSRKHRQKYHKFIAEGEKVVLEAIKEWPDQVEMVVVVPETFPDFGSRIPANVPCHEVSGKTMESISGMETPPGILCLIHAPSEDGQAVTAKDWILFLDGIKDPGNLGTILRTADWFGCGAVVLGPGCVDWSNPKAVQASMGSVFRVQTMEMNLEELVLARPEWPVFVSCMDGEDAISFPFPEKGILVLGSESHGVSTQILAQADHRITIGRSPGSRAESLNVATAAGILISRVRNPGRLE